MSRTRKSTLAERIAAAADLAPAERRVAEYFSKAETQIAFLPVGKIAQTLGVSTATVVRTAQALGYAGLPDLKTELQEKALHSWTLPTTRIEHSLDELTPDIEGFTEQSMRICADRIELAARSVPDDDVRHAVQLLGGAARTVIYSNPTFRSITEYFAHGLRRFGRPAVLIGRDLGQTPDDLLDLASDDAVLVVAYAQVNPLVETVLDRAREVQAPSVLVTDVLALALQGRYTVALTAPAGDLDMFPTATVPLALLETLLLAIGSLDRARTRSALAKRDELRIKLDPHVWPSQPGA
jgi:DNA-binding MurR/RpiR family transcriptional regulator